MELDILNRELAVIEIAMNERMECTHKGGISLSVHRAFAVEPGER